MEIRQYPLKMNAADLLQALSDQKGFFLLESSLLHQERGRYSFAGYDPFAIVSGHRLETFYKLQEQYRKLVKKSQCLTPFSAGIAGFVSYDFGLKFENLRSRHNKNNLVPGFSFGFYDRIITIDHWKKRLILTSSGWPEMNLSLRRKRALKRLNETEAILSSIQRHAPDILNKHPTLPRLKSHFSKAGYCNAVQKVLDYIKKGDIYQANIAQEFSCEFSQHVAAAPLYSRLRQLSPSCFGGYWNDGSFQIVSSSPEMFLTVENNIVRTRPMKGTRPRGLTVKDDRRRRQELSRNHKEQAELLMVTDLERNDLGRVCEYGTVKVDRIREIEKYRTVYQATAAVSGRLFKGKDGFDAIRACFPSGSVTGCPKIRSMEIIDQLEGGARGIYTGALGYMSFSGDMAFNVLIRTMLVSGKRVSFHVGSGIVADSHPLDEYEETLVKAQAMCESLQVSL